MNLCQEDVAEVRVCRTLGPCTKDAALLPVVYAPFDPQTGVSSLSFQLECPLGTGGNQVALEVALVRFAEVPVLRALIQCSQCREGQSRTEDKASDTWFCVACAANEYVMDPNNAAHSCQACPAGGSCNGSAFTPLPGSEWERDDAAGVYRILSCAPGSFIVTAPYRLQACLPCQAGYYCPGGAAPALKCPTDTFGAPGARAKEACVKADFVGLTVSLPFSESEFDEAKQTGYRRAMASSAGVNASSVEIVSFAQTSTRRSEARKLLAAAIDVETKIANTEGNTEDVIKRLNTDTINQNLLQNGLPPGKVTRTPAVMRDATADTWWTTPRIILVVAGLVLGLFLIGLVAFMRSRNRVEKSYEDKRQDARWRVEARLREFEERFAADKERTREAQERKKRQEVRAMRRNPIVQISATAPIPQVEASLHMAGTVPQGNVLEFPEPAAAVLSPEVVVIENNAVPPPVQDPVQTETKFEARKLVLGKSEDSVLLKHLGLTEKALALALADPMAAIEQEWFPRGFRLLEQEPQVGKRKTH